MIDWALIESWKNAGIPLEAVLRGIDVAFEKWRARSPRARIHQVNSVAYCAQAIGVEAQALANAGSTPHKETAAPFPMEDVRAYLARNVQTLRTAGFPDTAAALEAIPVDELYQDLEQMEQRLTAIEEKLIAQLRASATEEALFEARRALAMDLKPYRSKMSAEQLAMLEKQFLERRLLESKRLPRLSLFYL